MPVNDGGVPVTDTDRHGRKSNNPVWEGDVHADCRALETVLAVQLAAARIILTDLAATRAVVYHEGGPYCRYCRACLIAEDAHDDECLWQRAHTLLAGTTEPDEIP